MSYDIRLLDPKTRETIEFDERHKIRGGTYALGGTTEAWLNITYNYCEYFYKHIDPKDGIRWLYGKTAEETIPILKGAIASLGTRQSKNYWKPTRGNAGIALEGLLYFAELRPDGIWAGD